MEKCYLSSLKTHVPVIVSADGNCFYSSLSKFLYGDEAFYVEIKERVLMEMIINFKVLSKEIYLGEENYKWLRILSKNSENLGNDGKLILHKVIIFSLPNDQNAGVWHLFDSARSLNVDIEPFIHSFLGKLTQRFLIAIYF